MSTDIIIIIYMNYDHLCSQFCECRNVFPQIWQLDVAAADSTLTHNINSGFGGLGAAVVGARDPVHSVIRPHGLLDEQTAVLALSLHNHPLFVDFSFIFGPFDVGLGSTGHRGGKLQRLASFDDDAVLHRGIKFHSRSLCSMWTTGGVRLD